MTERFGLHDRYSATGTPRPDPKTVCLGPCEGMGCVPVTLKRRKRAGDRWYDKLVEAYHQSLEDGKEPDEVGYIFVTCPACNGSRLREKKK